MYHWKLKVKWLSHVLLLVTPWNVAYQASQSMLFSGKSTGLAFSFSRGSSLPKGPTQVSRIAGRYFTLWATTTSLLIAKSAPC